MVFVCFQKNDLAKVVIIIRQNLGRRDLVETAPFLGMGSRDLPAHGNDYRIQKKITERKILYEFIQ